MVIVYNKWYYVFVYRFQVIIALMQFTYDIIILYVSEVSRNQTFTTFNLYSCTYLSLSHSRAGVA